MKAFFTEAKKKAIGKKNSFTLNDGANFMCQQHNFLLIFVFSCTSFSSIP